MMRVREFVRRLLFLLILPEFAGCSYIKSLFPDKERDYQFRTEIPELRIPEDLMQQNAADKKNALQASNETNRAEAPASVSESKSAQVETETKYVADKEPVNQPSSSPQSQSAASNPAVSSLQIDQPQKQAWRLVGRALNRQKVEILERNIGKAYYYVKYDPDEKKPEDNSFWDEMLFLFGDDPSHEQEYRISMTEIAPQITEVTVQNSDGQTLSSRPATHLLKLITDGINMDLPAAKDENESEPTVESP